MPTTREILGYVFRERSVCAQKVVCLVSVDPGEGEPEAVLLECLYASITAALEVVGRGKFEVATVQEDLEDRQVWSITQFYSVDSSQSAIGVSKCVLNRRTIKVFANWF